MAFSFTLFSSLKCRIWGDPYPIVEVPKQTTLAGLPCELLFLVADFLFWEDVACISLCNRRLYATFYLWINSTPRSKNGKLHLINRLERDLPCYFTCYVCHILHKFDASKNNWSDALLITGHRRANRSIDHLPRWFNAIEPLVSNIPYVQHVQIITRSIHYGLPFGISIDGITHTEVQLHSMNLGSTGPQITLLYSTDAQMCSSSEASCLQVVVRIQQIMFVQHNQRYLMYCDPNRRTIRSPPLSMYSVCEHLSIEEFADIVNSTVRAHHDGEKNPSSSYTCTSNECDTNYRVEISECEIDLALIITKWFSLGSILSPNDSQWKSHPMDCTQTPVGTGKANLPRRKRKSGTRVCFENLNILQSRNISYLKNQRYKEVMHEDEYFENHWYLLK